MDTGQFEREIKKDEEIIKREERDIGSLDTKIEALNRAISQKEQQLKLAQTDLAKAKKDLEAIMAKENDIRQNLLPKDIEERNRIMAEKEGKKATVIKIQNEMESAKKRLEEAVNKQKNA